MPEEQMEEGKQMSTDVESAGLPQEIASSMDKFQEGSQQIFIAAFKSAKENGMDEQAALNVAWNTVKHDYVEQDGVWRRRPQQENVHNKAVQAGGN